MLRATQRIASPEHGGVAQHVVDSIARSNERHAVRSEDVVDLAERRPAVAHGKGAWKKWLPQMVLRACWGARPARQIQRQRLPSKQS
eukprot:2865871-Lingulodinium_polyedra.AAC.1